MQQPTTTLAAPPEWFTAATAADYAALSVWTIRAAVKAGELPAYAIGTGRAYRLRRDDIDEWLMSRSWEPR